IRSGLILMIKDLAGKGKSAYAIGQEIGISKNTARKYMEQADRQHGLKGISKGSKLDPYKPQLNEWMEQGIFNCVVLLERLRELGYDGGISILKAYVHPYRPAKAAPAVRRYETPSGKQAQMDWGICQYLDQNEKLHKVAVFVMILGYSRAKYIEFVKRCDLRSMERCMLNAFQYFGGVPRATP
ncbi:IS21 family transposase, partial [Faecalibacterium sp. An77]